MIGLQLPSNNLQGENEGPGGAAGGYNRAAGGSGGGGWGWRGGRHGRTLLFLAAFGHCPGGLRRGRGRGAGRVGGRGRTLVLLALVMV